MRRDEKNSQKLTHIGTHERKNYIIVISFDSHSCIFFGRRKIDLEFVMRAALFRVGSWKGKEIAVG